MRENFFWHKLHSLTGIIPVGFYMVQHITLNTFSLGGEEKFNGVIHFFEGMPKHFLLGLEVVAIWLPLLFHAVYGLFITSRMNENYTDSAYKYRENRYYLMQRISGILVFLFLVYHVTETTINAKINGAEVILYDAWAAKLQNPIILIVYILGVLGASYHLCYGIWNFCIRWGITISRTAQERMAKFSFGAFVVITLMAWAALAGFLIHKPSTTAEARGETQMAPASSTALE